MTDNTPTTKQEEGGLLLPCPHCGTEQATDALDLNGVWIEKNDYDDPEYHVRCWSCGARSKECPGRDEAITRWNTRAPATPVHEEGVLIEPSSLRVSAALALMYLETGFDVCERCGHENPTKDFDAAYELRDGLASPPHNEDGLREALQLLKQVTDGAGCQPGYVTALTISQINGFLARQALGNMPSG